jgi:hypothetical protein
MIPFSFWRFAPLGALSAFLLASCAGPSITPSSDPRKLLETACEPGAQIQSVKGSLWMKVTSKAASGQFPAEVLARAPGSVHLEVTNLIGSTQAKIDVQGGQYRIEALDQNGELKPMGAGKDSWGGIPLRWASDLFLGRVPCPGENSRSTARVSMGPDDTLRVESQGQVFTYRFRNWAGRPWAEGLVWEVSGGAKRVEFKFDDPEDHTRSPKKWEARSSDGEVKVRWKDREIAR